VVRADDASVYGLYALPVTPPARTHCDVCGGPAAFARVLQDETVDAWCGPGCATGRRADELRVGEHVAIWAARFPEVETWPDRRGDVGRDVWPFGGFARLAVVSSVTDDEVALTNPGGARPGQRSRAPQGTDARHWATQGPPRMRTRWSGQQRTTSPRASSCRPTTRSPASPASPCGGHVAAGVAVAPAVAFWDSALDSWDVRPHDGSPTQLA
jgi:hypothetical protein